MRSMESPIQSLWKRRLKIKKMKTALVQIKSGSDKQKNINKVLCYVEEAVQKKAKFILLPEIFNFRGKVNRKMLTEDVAEKIPGESLRPLMSLAKAKRVVILAGSVYERTQNKSKQVYNTSVLIDAKGNVAAKYRKMHLFDAVLKQGTIRESRLFTIGQKSALVPVFKFSLGLSICFDLRFPSQYQQYARQGATMFSVPSSFLYQTGKGHRKFMLCPCSESGWFG